MVGRCIHCYCRFENNAGGYRCCQLLPDNLEQTALDDNLGLLYSSALCCAFSALYVVHFQALWSPAAIRRHLHCLYYSSLHRHPAQFVTTCAVTLVVVVVVVSTKVRHHNSFRRNIRQGGCPSHSATTLNLCDLERQLTDQTRPDRTRSYQTKPSGSNASPRSIERDNHE